MRTKLVVLLTLMTTFCGTFTNALFAQNYVHGYRSKCDGPGPCPPCPSCEGPCQGPCASQAGGCATCEPDDCNSYPPGACPPVLPYPCSPDGCGSCGPCVGGACGSCGAYAPCGPACDPACYPTPPCSNCGPLSEPCSPSDPCDPCAPACGTFCGLSCVAIGLGIAAVAAVGAIIVASGTGHASHTH